MGGDNVDFRKKGAWSLEEGLALLKAVVKASGLNLLKSSRDVELKYKDKGDHHSKRISVLDDKIKIYS
jgi:hypothetical protein